MPAKLEWMQSKKRYAHAQGKKRNVQFCDGISGVTVNCVAECVCVWVVCARVFVGKTSIVFS